MAPSPPQARLAAPRASPLGVLYECQEPATHCPVRRWFFATPWCYSTWGGGRTRQLARGSGGRHPAGSLWEAPGWGLNLRRGPAARLNTVAQGRLPYHLNPSRLDRYAHLGYPCLGACGQVYQDPLPPSQPPHWCSHRQPLHLWELQGLYRTCPLRARVHIQRGHRHPSCNHMCPSRVDPRRFVSSHPTRCCD